MNTRMNAVARAAGWGHQISLLGHEGSGNRCGHNPHDFCSDIAAIMPTNDAPELLRKMDCVVRGLAFDRTLLGGLFAEKRNTTKSRRIRSERMEAMIRVIRCSIKYLDINSLQIGFWRSGSVDPLSNRNIAHFTGMTLNRVERAIKDLKNLGVLIVHQRIEKQVGADGEQQCRALVAVKRLNKTFVRLCGLHDDLKYERKKKKKKEKRLANRRVIDPDEKFTDAQIEQFRDLQERGMLSADVRIHDVMPTKNNLRPHPKKNMPDLATAFDSPPDPECADIPY